MKQCTGCKEVKPLSEFYKDKYRKDGLTARCKQCFLDWQRTDKGKEVMYRAGKKYYQTPRGRASYNRRSKEYIQRHPDKYKERYTNYHRFGNYKEVMKRHKQTETFRHTKKKADYKRRSGLDSIPGDHTPSEWKMMCQHFDHKCVCCGKQFPFEELTKDHIIPLGQEGCTNDISNIQPLCTSCNSTKGNRHSIDYRDRPIWWEQLRLFE